MLDPTETQPAPLKPGWKTTEFYFHLLVATVNALIISDVLIPGSTTAKFVSVVALVLQGLGYNVSRSRAKAGASSSASSGSSPGFVTIDVALLLAMAGLFGMAISSGCSAAKSAGKQLGGSVIDCAAEAALDATRQYAPAVEQLLQRATTPEGEVDLPSLEQATQSFAADTGWCVVENVVAAALARLPLPGAPQSSPLQADPDELKRALAAIRASRYEGKTFRPAVGGP